MKKSNNSGLQNSKNAATKRNSGKNSGVRNKEKFALWAYPDTLEEVEAIYEQDNCRSKSEFIEKAIRFYLGYLKQEGNVDYLAPRIKSIMEAVVYGAEDRTNRNLFKIAVELGKLSHTLAAANDVDEETLRELHMMCIDEVRHINGTISFERAVRFQNEEDE